MLITAAILFLALGFFCAHKQQRPDWEKSTIYNVGWCVCTAGAAVVALMSSHP
jgi:hypothetical protein